MDGVQELVGVTIVAATNRPEAIDSALMRPGRLDRILYVGPPDAAGREEILRIRTAKMTVEPDLDYAELARMVRYVHSIRNSDIDQNLRPKGAPAPNWLRFARRLRYRR